MTTKDRAELIALVRKYEAERSQWEFRIRVCEEKEQLWKNIMRDMGVILAKTFQKCHDSISERAEEAAQVMEKLQAYSKHVENL